MVTNIKTLAAVAALVSLYYGETAESAANEVRASYEVALNDMIEEGEL